MSNISSIMHNRGFDYPAGSCFVMEQSIAKDLVSTRNLDLFYGN
ncbi:MAG: hypothetical protein H6Q62_387, partial [Firmicutes bacterium]|nr:hypothetical protein [Bacillota bacterium]